MNEVKVLEEKLKQLYDGVYFDGNRSNYRKTGGYWEYPIFSIQASLIKQIFNPTRALDAGCAKGFLVHHLRKLGVDAFGTDISEYAIQAAGSEVQPYVQTAVMHALPFPDNYFDTVVSFEVMEHIPGPFLTQSIAELARVASKTLFFTIAREGDTSDKTHFSLLPVQTWVEKFQSVGLTYDVNATKFILSQPLVMQMQWQPYVFHK